MERITRFRARVLALLLVAVIMFFSFRLYDLQIIENDGKTSTQATVTVRTRVKAARGHIHDTNGNVLVAKDRKSVV